MIHIPTANNITIGPGTLYISSEDSAGEMMSVQVHGGAIGNLAIDSFDTDWVSYGEVVPITYDLATKVGQLEIKLAKLEKVIQDMGIEIELMDIQELI